MAIFGVSALERYFSQGHTRTVQAKKNVLALFAIRAISILVSFLLVPLTIHYLNTTQYGIWLTLTSIIGSVNLLDIGLGNGMRNKFAEARARDDKELARTYISTTYVAMGLFVVVAISVFLLVNPFLHWATILNAPADLDSELGLLAAVVFVFFCLRLLFNLIGTLMVADQKPAISSLLELLTNILSLIAIYALTRSGSGSLFRLGFAVSGLSALVPLVASIWYFAREYKPYLPAYRLAKLQYARELMSLGVQFFILQIAVIVIFSSSNLIITQLFGPQEVTPFNIAYKYFGVASMAFVVILTPFWTAYTEAYVKKDNDWIARSNKKLRMLWAWMAAGVLVMILIANPVYKIWVGESVHVPVGLSIFMGVYVLIGAWSNIFVYFINGTGKIRLQLVASIVASIVNVILAIVLASYFGWGTTGVVAATCIALLPGCILWPVQMKKLMSGSAKGIWAK